MPSKYCCVPNCYNKDDKSFRLTAIKKAKEIWIQRIGNPDLKNLRYPSNALVCRNHFHADCIGIDGKLKKFALPTLNLPEYVSSPQNDDLFLYSSNKIHPESPEKNQDQIETTMLDDMTELKIQIPRRVYERRSVIQNELAGPSRHT